MSSAAAASFVETREHRRFTEFCDACQRFRYIGLCYGPPGVGKTLSARQYTLWDEIEARNGQSGNLPEEAYASTAAFYTAPVVNAPRLLEREIAKQRAILHELRVGRERAKEERRMIRLLDRAEALRDRQKNPEGYRGEKAEKAESDFYASRQRLMDLAGAIPNPTALIIIDEADRLKVASLEQVRALFDDWGIGFILIGMPGIEKRLARYPQLYSRIGFVHQFQPLAQTETRRVLRQWRPPGVTLPEGWIDDEEILAAILRITGGNFRLIDRLLTQIARVFEINRLDRVSPAVVEAARESLVIGTV
jgi:DNA transposition AAA+ family ATPase